MLNQLNKIAFNWIAVAVKESDSGKVVELLTRIFLIILF